ncbi:MAG TPA: TlyA family RNA methyltransferase [Vicinamibacteria bacterium]|jgi:23S rRNA (cytidine1920-2'-O)/16S rRNA (cytidine1409-2'-O)-methyltransferase|nr:TlyA family RNA methyltransferase [Vicinamibacteria bacterium]
MSRGPRLDVWLVDHGLAESRQKAQALVMTGRVRVDGAVADKPGTAVRAEANVELAAGPEHVGRGALKLAGALDTFGIDPAGGTVIDVGASTGGFTETLLGRGAARVYAVDVGRGQLHERLRADPRVLVRDRVNARALSTAEVPEPCRLATVDVAFISALKILPALRDLLAPGADVVLLVKPQFEAGRAEVGRGGLVKDEGVHRRVLVEVMRGAQELAYAVAGACASPLLGGEGNREFFLHLRREGEPLAPEAVAGLAAKAVAS